MIMAMEGDMEYVTVKHLLKRSNIIDYPSRTRGPVEPGEIYDTVLPREFENIWWHWGDLKTDLKDKKFHICTRSGKSGT